MMRIAIVTGSRAEYGLLSPLISAIDLHADLELHLIATGSHPSHKQGSSLQEIESDGRRVDDVVEMLLDSSSSAAIGKSTGLGVILMAEALQRAEPDLVVILGDRYEILATAIAAHFLRIPIAHLHGGEVTRGSLDDSTRHAITKLSRIHFAATETYRRRLIQMGESPDWVFNVGAIGLDRIRGMDFLPEGELASMLDIVLTRPFAVVTLHPDTIDPTRGFQTAIDVTKALEQSSVASGIVTGANADESGDRMNDLLKTWVDGTSGRFQFRQNLGSRLYLSAVRHADVVVGNSSSGIIEAPFLDTPTVDIGDRQYGRVVADSVRHVDGGVAETAAAIDASIAAKAPPRMSSSNPYYAGGAADQIVQVLLRSGSLPKAKTFVDQPVDLANGRRVPE